MRASVEIDFLQELLIADLSGNVGVDDSKVIPLIKKLTRLANEQITEYTGGIDAQENHSEIYQKFTFNILMNEHITCYFAKG